MILWPEHYPENLREVYEPPEFLYYEGNSELLKKSSVVIVGSRTPTAYGLDLTEKLVEKFITHDIVIVSGFARGIDFAAHRSAIMLGGNTIGVLGCGLLVDYPKGRRSLRAVAKDHILLLTEHADEVLAHPYHFPKRNRILAALADHVIIVECTLKSGTMNTARHAMEQGRTVWALPGRVTDDLSAGPNRLIQEGANPLLDIEDIIEEIEKGRPHG